MIRYLKTVIIQNIVSPVGLAMASYCIFLFAWLFPPGLYTDYIHEPDLMFLDPLSFAFYTSCIAAFLLGVRASRYIGGATRRNPVARIVVRNPLRYLGLPIFLALVLCSIYLTMIGGKLDFIGLLVSQQGGSIKAAGQFGQLAAGRWSGGLFMLTAALWWSAFRARQLTFKGISKLIFRTLFFLSVVVDLVTCVATVDRTNLITLIAGFSVIYIFGKTYSTNGRILKLVFIGLSSAVGVVAAFLFISFLRGAVALRELVMLLLGYTIVSYNRMAAVLLGILHDAYAGRGAYLFPILRENQTLNNIFHFNELFDWPSSYSLWASAFTSVGSAGLNAGFNFYSVFGALYSDLGWFTLAYLFVIGLLVGYMWIHFRAGEAFAIVLYPWCAFCILFWTGFNVMFDGRVIDLIKMAIFLGIYDKLTVRQTQDALDMRAYADPGGAFSEHVTSGSSAAFLK